MANSSLQFPLSLVLASLPLLLVFSGLNSLIPCQGFTIKEATITEIQHASRENKLNSRQLVEFYLKQIHELNPILLGVIELNPDALKQADAADRDRQISSSKGSPSLSALHGIPVLLKDNIGTKDKLNTTAGSLALLGSVVARDAGVVERLRRSGAIILGKASLTEWSAFRSGYMPPGWCARVGQGKNPYVLSETPCGSSSGPALTVAANMVSVSVGSETDGSILCPASSNSVVGIKPTLGLTSRAGVIPITPRQDSIGPFGRSVSDAVDVLDVIVGLDRRDEATIAASKFIPAKGYRQFLREDGLKGKRLGIVRKPFFAFLNTSIQPQAFKTHFDTLRRKGAILVDNLEIPNINVINLLAAGGIATLAEFKLSLNRYLSELVSSPVRSLADVIAFNKKHSVEEKVREYGQSLFESSQKTNGIRKKEKIAILAMSELSRIGLEKLMKKHKLDALVTPESSASTVLAIGGYPGISVPAGYELNGSPFGICFGGLRGSEPTLIEIAYGFEQATKIRKPPSFRP